MKIILWGYPLPQIPILTSTKHLRKHLNIKFMKFIGLLMKAHPHDFDYDNCLFFCEGYRDKKIPLRKTSTYVCHVCVNPEVSW